MSRLLLALLVPLVLLCQLIPCWAGGLDYNFYQKTCPNVAAIVRNITWSQVATNPNLPAKLLRLFFHDCFVQGCDASILLDNPQSEKQASPNQSLGGFDVIDAIKTQLETACPGVVSCADILALASRDAVSLQFKASLWQVETGRRDGNVSLASNVNLPSPFSNFAGLNQIFTSKGLDISDLVALSGAHTIGRGNCAIVTPRLFNFNGNNGSVDPLLDSNYATTLQTMCPNPSPAASTVEMDPGSSLKFDSHYYIALKKNQGLFQSDAALLQNPAAAKIVSTLQDPIKFYAAFSISMKKMGRMGVLTDTAGGIRTQCRVAS